MNGKRTIKHQPRPCETLKDLMAILGGGCRIDLLVELSRGPADVSDLTHQLDLCMPCISHNLKCLRAIDLVRVQQIGKHRLYSISPRLRCKRLDGRMRFRLRLQNGDWVDFSMVLTPAVATNGEENHDQENHFQTNGLLPLSSRAGRAPLVSRD